MKYIHVTNIHTRINLRGRLATIKAIAIAKRNKAMALQQQAKQDAMTAMMGF